MFNKKFPYIFYITFSLCLLILPIVGCGTIEAETPLSQAGNSNAAEIESGESGLGEIGTVEVGGEPPSTPESTSYTNETYGFTFDYPETWTLSEQDHGVVLQNGPNRLGINFRRANEQIDQFGRTGIGAGDFVYAGKVNFLNQIVPAEALLFENKPKAVFYGESGRVKIGDRVFLIALEDLESDYAAVDLSDEIIAEANLILESFRDLAIETGAETSAAANGLEAYLEVQNSIQQGSAEPIIMHFTLENHTQQGLYILKWYTPLEGMGGDIFQVKRDGQLIPYLGPLASRTEPTPESYIFLEPGQGVTAEVDIAQAYDFSQLGTYTIKFRSPRISHIAESEAELATTLDELGPVEILSNEITLEVVDSSMSTELPVHRTAGEAAEMISAYLLKQNLGLMKAPPLTFEEVPDEAVWQELQGQIFRATEGIIQGDSFLLRHDSTIQLGEALGGQGLTSLVVADLDQDGQSELFFSYIAGLGPRIGPGIQTRVGMVELGFETLRATEADMAYLGSAALKPEETTGVSLYVVEADETTKVLRYRDRLGYLSLENTETDVSLVFNVDPNLPSEIRQNVLIQDGLTSLP
ncbi:MAG: hypothetical protein P8183_12435 [Anaerolineae bacterium]